jgi:hypothetical protein
MMILLLQKLRKFMEKHPERIADFDIDEFERSFVRYRDYLVETRNFALDVEKINLAKMCQAMLDLLDGSDL